MNELNQKDWLVLNRQYLMTSIEVVAAQLRLYQAKIEEEKVTLENYEQQLIKAKKELLQFKESLPKSATLDILVHVFGLSNFEKDVLLLCAGIELDAHIAQLVTDLQKTETLSNTTFSLALAALPNAHWLAILPESPLRNWQLINIHTSTILTQSILQIDESILHYLVGLYGLDHELKDFVQLYTDNITLATSHQNIANQLIKSIVNFPKQASAPLIHLTGKNQKDKLAIAKQVFAQHNLMTYTLLIQLLPQKLQELSKIAQRWNRMVALTNVALFLDATQLEKTDTNGQYKLQYFISQLNGLVILGSHQQSLTIQRPILTISIKKPQREEQVELWKNNFGLNGTSPKAPLDRLTMQFDFDATTIQNLAQETMLRSHSKNSTKDQLPTDLWNICQQSTRPNLDELAQRIESIAQWDDLVLPKAQKRVLEAISQQVEHRLKVYHQWGFAKKNNRGLGISALFAGESGTGKTMASEVLAHALGLDLYKIDLSQVVNKYIGETEKNLKKIFDSAEENGAILLFDEADALFGKRSEVKDSHDRHANIEVSYLLQRMESYRGLAILTTNMKKVLDKAFLRRISFVVNFPFPNAKLRAEIWRRIFPKNMPIEPLNYQKLANLNIAGGNIKNIALNAAFIAAHKNHALTMQDIQEAARNEYTKLDKQMSPAEILIR